MVSELTHNINVVGSNLVSSNLLDGNGVKVMQGSIPAPNKGSVLKFSKSFGLKTLNKK
jgi:hypothetical protein